MILQPSPHIASGTFAGQDSPHFLNREALAFSSIHRALSDGIGNGEGILGRVISTSRMESVKIWARIAIATKK